MPSNQDNVQFYRWLARHKADPWCDIDVEKTVDLSLELLIKAGFVQKPNQRLLELGCGAGKALSEWSQRGFIVTGLDSSAAMLKKAKKLNPNVQLMQKNALEIGEVSEPYDLVVSHLYFVNLFSPDELPQLFAQVAMTLKPGGFFAFDYRDQDGDANDANTFRNVWGEGKFEYFWTLNLTNHITSAHPSFRCVSFETQTSAIAILEKK